MRTYTLAFSILVHCVIVTAVVIAPIVATDTLPEPRRAFDYIIVTPFDPPPPPPTPPPGETRRKPRPNAVIGAPIEAPDRIAPESGLEFGSVELGQDGGVPDGIPGIEAGNVPIADPPPPPPPARAAPIRVGGSIRPPQKIRHVAPVYPQLALAARREGTVILEALIGEDGKVRHATVLRPIPLLDQAAIDAVRQWQFTPTLLNGEPVPIVMTVTVTFELTP